MDCTEVICPVCNSVIKETDEVIQCGKCGSTNHKDCWEINGGCGNSKCGIKSQPDVRPAANTQYSSMPSGMNTQQQYTPQNQNAFAGGYQQQGNNSLPNQQGYGYPPDWAMNGQLQYNNAAAVKTHNPVKVTLIIIFVLIVIAGIAVFAIMGFINYSNEDMQKAQTASKYIIGNNSIPSVNSVLGERKITSMSKSNSGNKRSITYTFFSSDRDNDIKVYVNYLINNDGFRYDLTDNKKGGITALVANAKENGKILIIEIEPDTNGYNITYRLNKGYIYVI